MTPRVSHAALLVASGWMLLAATGAPAAAQSVSVTAANPASGTQDTVGLIVKITGKNFAPGARSQFLLSGTTNPDGIVVRGTQFVSATEVDALIDIAPTASLASFDIRVTNASGRSGKGSDLFQVIQKSSVSLLGCAKHGTCAVTNLSVQLLDVDAFNAPYPVRSDGRGPYSHGVDHVTAQFLAGGVFAFDTGTVPPATRDMISEYIFPLPGYAAYSPLVQPGAHYRWRTNGVTSTAAQDLGTPGFPASKCVEGYFYSTDVSELSDIGEAYSTLYHTGIEGSGSPTGMWLMTRTGPTTWTLETSPTCNGDAVNLRHRIPGSKSRQGLWQWETIGYFHLPFKMILTLQ